VTVNKATPHPAQLKTEWQ